MYYIFSMDCDDTTYVTQVPNQLSVHYIIHTISLSRFVKYKKL